MNVGFKSYATVDYKQAGFTTVTDATKKLNRYGLYDEFYYDKKQEKLIVNNDDSNWFNKNVMHILEAAMGYKNVNYDPCDDIYNTKEQSLIKKGIWKKLQ